MSNEMAGDEVVRRQRRLTCRAASVLALALLTITVKGAAPAGVTLAIAGRSNANASVSAAGALVAVVWSAALPAGTTDIYSATSADGGATFSSPARVNAVAGDAQVTGEQPPRVVIIPRADRLPSLVVVWTSKRAGGTALLTARSDDGGRTFGQATPVPGSDAPGNRGWQNITADRQGNVHVVWLDHREMAPPSQTGNAAGAAMPHAGHDPSGASKMDGVAMAQRSKLYIATLGAPKSAQAITGGVCYCCKTGITTAADGSIYAVWRHVYPGNLRDIAFTMSQRGQPFTAPVRVSEDKWQIEGCPDDGPALAVDATQQIHVVWPTLVADGPDGRPTIGIFYARTADGRTFTARERIATEGLAHHPQIAVTADRILLAWDESRSGTRKAVVGARPLRGTTAFSRSVISGDTSGVYPVLTPVGSSAVVAWTSGDVAGSVIRIAQAK